MKIDVLTLIEDALIGGRNGEMAYIYNNPFVFELFNQWKNKSDNLKLYQGNDTKAFKGFLEECLKEDKEEPKKGTEEVKEKKEESGEITSEEERKLIADTQESEKRNKAFGTQIY